ncbi:MAG: hypothetical protein ACJ780_17590 [Solirubrobacteraceae bacterium]
MPDVRATDPITLGTPPAGSQLAELWKATDGRFPESRKRIRRARDVTNRDRTTLGTDPGFLTLPQRLMAVTMTNSMASQYGTPELTRYGRPTASDKADEIETIVRASLEGLVDVTDLFGKATQDGEWGIAVMPAETDWASIPAYSEEGYSLDADDRRPDDGGYRGRDAARSRKGYDRDREDWLAQQQYVVVDLIDPTDCAPILVRGTHGRRWEARGLVVRRLFTRDDLLGRGYRAECLASEHATLIPRGASGNVRGKGGRIWLYTAYLTLWDEDDEQLVPCIAYSVGGQDTTRRDPSSDEDRAAVINLKEQYGITTPMWGYYHGLHTADPEPDMAGIPFMDAYADLVLSLERMLSAGVHHAERSAFRGSWVEPSENVPEAAYTETVDNQLRLKRFEPPMSGELVTAPGRVVPDAPPPLGSAATQMLAAMQSVLGQTAPDPANPAGTGASGHAMSLASGLIEAAHGDIPRGVLACYEDLACWLLECLCAVMRTYEVPYVLDANEELPPESPGSRRFVTQRYVLTERDIGRSYKLSATWRQKPDPTNITVTMDRATRGYASVVDVLEAAGETNSTYKIAEIIYYRAVMTPGTPENLELSAYVARKRGETEKAQQQELQAKGMLGPQGTPTDAIAPEAEQMAQAAAGGGNPPMGPSGIQTGVRSSIAATVQGARGVGPASADAMQAAAMGVRPALAGANGTAPGASGGPV